MRSVDPTPAGPLRKLRGGLRCIALAAALAAPVGAQPVPEAGPPVFARDSFALGVGAATLVVQGTGPHPALLNLHDDEDTSVEAALGVVSKRGGVVFELRHTGERNLAFRADGDGYVVDPNRMFTDAGRRASLQRLSRDAPAAREAVAGLAEVVLDLYAALEPRVLVTLHNNTPDNYSANSYAAGGAYEQDAAAVTVHPGSDPDDFFFVTDRGLYDALVACGFNAVLQDNARASDDGSLSVWAAQQGLPYVNVEAEHGHRTQQVRMIEALYDVLGAR